MIVEFAEQISFEEFSFSEYDFLIVASGYESRGITLSKKIHSKIKSKIAIGFKEHKNNINRIKNDKFFSKLKFQMFEAEEGNFQEIINILDEVFNRKLIKDNLSVVIDYSCMSKIWYSTILNYFLNKDNEIKKLEIIFCYTISKFSKPKIPMPNKYMGPLPGLYRISSSNKPTALILGLGYERNAAKGLVEYLDPNKSYAFYTKPTMDNRFSEIVEKNNLSLLERLGKNHIFTHSINDLKLIDSLLFSLCQSLQSKYRIILAPLGPKPFTLMCLLTSIKLQNIDVWRVSSGNSGNLYDRVPENLNPIVCKVNLTNNIKKVKEYPNYSELSKMM